MSIKPRIGFVGLGQMGYPMASRLAKAGHPMLVKDANSIRELEFTEEFESAVSLRDCDWSEVSLVFLSLPNSAIVEEAVINDATGLINTLKPGALIVDLSSSQPGRTQALSQRLIDQGFRLVDAPISGGVKGAIAGTVAVMAGGNEHDFKEVLPYLQIIGNKVFHVGAVGSGHAAKALNNLVSAAAMTVTLEALLVAQKFGIDPHTFNSILNSSSGRTNASENKVEQFVLSRTFNSGFGLKLMAKDVHIAIELAESVGQKMPVSDKCDEFWTESADSLDPTVDHTRIYELLANLG